VAPDRPAELARAVRILLEYPDLRRAMGERARRHLEAQFTWDRALVGLGALYRELGLDAAAPAGGEG
jgi:glycosyltransferase involved in cell wall biosynthesis